MNGKEWTDIRNRLEEIEIINTDLTHEFAKRMRKQDRRFFKRVLSAEYMSKMEVHHEWSTGLIRCFVLTPEEHDRWDC